MIIKSFYRKKTTKMYIVIFFFIALTFGIVLVGKDYYKKRYNDNFINSYIEVLAKEDIDLSKVKNVKSSMKAFGCGIFYCIGSETVNENECIVPNNNKDIFPVGNFANAYDYNRTYNYTFKVVGYYEAIGKLSRYIYINNNQLEQLRIKENTYNYVVKLKDWGKSEETLLNIKKKFNVEAYLVKASEANVDFDSTIRNFTIFTYLIIGIFILVSVFTINNMIQDEKENNYVYRSLGYSKMKVGKILTLKIGSLFLISFLMSSVVVIVIKVIFKL